MKILDVGLVTFHKFHCLSAGFLSAKGLFFCVVNLNSLFLATENNSDNNTVCCLCVAVLMGTELMRVCIKEENDEVPSVPPGFESFASFTLKRVQDIEKHDCDIKSCSASASASESLSAHMETEVGVADVAKAARSLRRRPWINYGQLDHSSEDESDSGKLGQVSVI